MFKEHEEPNQVKKRGRKFSTLNQAAGNALLTSSIGPNPFIDLMLKLGIDPGSTTSLQKHINRAADALREVSKSNQAAEREKNSAGVGVSKGIAMDTCYNNRIYSPNTPFQAGTQAVTTVIDNDSGKILHVETSSKLCPVGERKRKKGDSTFTCGTQNSHSGCTANLPKTASIGDEAKYAESSAMILKKSNIKITSCTTDGDCSIMKGLQKVYKPQIEQQRDRRHLKQALIRAISKTTFSSQMFMDSNKENKRKRQTRFAASIGQRCAAEVTAAINQTKHTLSAKEKKEQMSKLMENIPKAIVSCYEKGKMHLCNRYSLVCSSQKRWDKIGLFPKDRNGFHMTIKDKETLKKCMLQTQFGKNAIELTYRGTSTQKVEATNRAYRAVNPKAVTSSRNWDARVQGRALFLNIGSYCATLRMLKQLGHDISSPVQTKLKARYIKDRYMRKYKQLAETKQRRYKTKIWNFMLYDEKNIQKQGTTYNKRCDLLPLVKGAAQCAAIKQP